MTKILAIDQGTTSSRAIVFSDAGEILHVAQKELKLYYPHNGWVEQNPDDIWNDTLSCVRECLNEHPDVVAIGVTNQRETTIIWDRETGKPVYNAIVWQDRRTADFCAELKGKNHEDKIRNKTGLLLDPYFSATKIDWILKNVPDARQNAEQGKLAFGTVETFLLWHLTGRKSHITDMSNASRTMLMNIKTLDWDNDLLELFDIPKSILPDIKENIGNFGIAKIGTHEVRVMGMAGDQQAALIGQACFEKGMIKSTYGTGCFALMNIGDTPKISTNKLLTSIGYVVNGKPTYVLEGSIFVAGAAIQWLRDEMNFFGNAAESESLAQSVEDSDGVIFIPAFTGLGAPYWNPDVRGTIFGLTRATTKAHITRAAIEAQAFQTCDLMGAMVKDSGITSAILRVDGGLVKNEMMVQFLSDMTGMQVDIPQTVETTALGAAYLAGLGAGVFKNFDDITANWKKDKSYNPTFTQEKREGLYAGWQKAISRLL